MSPASHTPATGQVPERSTGQGDGVPFALVDVFGAGPLTGNPLAVVDLHGHGRDEPPVEWLQAVAREFNQAETTFVLPATDDRAHRRLRSFTAGGVEVFGAGHNALGAWWWLLDTGRVTAPGDGVITQQIGPRLLEVTVDDGWLTMQQDSPRLGADMDEETVAAAVGVETGRLDPAVLPRVVGTGADHLIAGVDTAATLDALAPARHVLRALTEDASAQGLYLVVVGTDRPVTEARARFFNPGAGLDEDPATGSAAGPLAAYLARLGLLEDGGRLTVHQGESMQRPSTIYAASNAGRVSITGSAVCSAHGWLHPFGTSG
jgi:trans-2,3-dihydro-3-hydroxyanthranilate isomerase